MVYVKSFTPALLELTDGSLMKRELSCGQQAYALNLFDRFLRFRIESTNAVDLIIEQINTQRMGVASRKKVNNGTANGKLPMLINRINCGIPGVSKALAQ